MKSTGHFRLPSAPIPPEAATDPAPGGAKTSGGNYAFWGAMAGNLNLAVKPYDWLSERELCDRLWADKGLLNVCGDGADHFLREHEIGHGLRPDFLVFGQDWNGVPQVQVIEVRLTAGLESMTQLCNYVDVLRKAAWSWSVGRSCREPEVVGVMMARHFDRGVHSIAEAAGIVLSRAVVTAVGVETESEHHPFVGVPVPDDAIELFKAHTAEVARGQD